VNRGSPRIRSPTEKVSQDGSHEIPLMNTKEIPLIQSFPTVTRDCLNFATNFNDDKIVQYSISLALYV
jgi:hypothetical protein